MNELNKRFIEEFKERTRNFSEVDRQIRNIDNTRREIRNATYEIVKFLNDSVMSTATSSLVRTDVLMPKVAGDNKYYRDDCDEIITFNHKGVGTLRVKKEGVQGNWTYGTTCSEEVKTQEMLSIVSDATLRNNKVS